VRVIARILLAGALVGGGAAFAGTGALFHVSSAHADEAQPSIEENYDYPDAAKIEAERGIKLIKGDGHIVFVDCATSGTLIQVWSKTSDERFCFHVTKPNGYVTMELPDVYYIRGDDHDVVAKVTIDDETESVELEQNTWNPIGEGTSPDSGSATLLELRASA
jgi:hypothetical protein